MGVSDTVRETCWRLFSQPYEYAEVYDGPNSTDLIHGSVSISTGGWSSGTADGSHRTPFTE